MNLSSIGATNLNQLTSIGSVTSSATLLAGLDGGGDHDGPGSVRVSPLAQLLSQLQQLQQVDPSKLKTMLSDIANQLRATAQQEGGSQGATLSNLADKFQQAAQTGSLSSLQPTPHHHHHRHHGAAAYQASGTPTGASAAPDARSQALDIIGKVIGKNLGSTGIRPL